MRAVNLIPAEQRGGASPGAGRSGGGAYAVLALIGGLALLVVLYGVARHHVSTSKAKLASLEARVQRTQAEASSLAPYTSFVALRDQRLQAVSQLVNTRFDWAHAVHELGRVLPAGVSIASFSGVVGTSKGAPGTAASAPGAAGAASSSTPAGSVPAVTLSGCAKSQSIVAVTLDRLRLIDGVSSVVLQSSTKSASGGSSGGSGGCPGSDPAFSLQVNFNPLPAQSAPTSVPASAASTGAGSVKHATTQGAR